MNYKLTKIIEAKRTQENFSCKQSRLKQQEVIQGN